MVLASVYLRALPLQTFVLEYPRTNDIIPTKEKKINKRSQIPKKCAEVFFSSM